MSNKMLLIITQSDRFFYLLVNHTCPVNAIIHVVVNEIFFHMCLYGRVNRKHGVTAVTLHKMFTIFFPNEIP